MNKRQAKKLKTHHGLCKRSNGWYKEVKDAKKATTKIFGYYNPNINIYTIIKKRDKAGCTWYKAFQKNKTI